MDNEADLLWEWLSATIRSRQDAAPTEKVNFQGISVLKNGASGCQPRRTVSWKAQHIGRYVSISKGPWNAGSRPAAPFF